MTVTRSPARWLAALFLLVTAGTHVPLIGEHLEEAPYVGVLFIALTVVSVVLAVAVVVADRDELWLASGAVCLAAVLAYLASRTIGLPQIGDDIGNWTEPMSYPAVAAEVAMVALAWLHLHGARTPAHRAIR